MRIFLPIVLLSLSGCVSSVSDGAICTATRQEQKVHSAALANLGETPRELEAQSTGVVLLTHLDAGCNQGILR